MKGALLLLLVLVAEKSQACTCGPMPLVERVAHADFVAVAKILKVSPDPQSERFHDIDIEITSLFKGEKISSLKIRSALKTSCAFYTPENTTWLIFAYRDKEGVLSFGFCSGGIQLDRKYNSTEFPKADDNYRRAYELKLEVLKYMKRKNISPANEFQLNTVIPEDCLKKFDGYEVDGRFAIYKVEINPDLSIAGIKALKQFGDPKLRAGLWNCISNKLKVYSRDKSKQLPRKTEVIIILYHYPAGGGHESVIGTFDV